MMNINKKQIYILFFVFLMGIYRCDEAIDPVVDFRTPISLFEVMHDGMNDICRVLQSLTTTQGMVRSEMMKSAQDKVIDMMSIYASTVDTMRNHQIISEDKAFLQAMLDRINSLIETLEGNDDDSEEEYQSLKNSCDQLKALVH